MIEVKLVWATPDGDNLLAYIARVSNPANQNHHESAPKLVRYMLDHGHVSPFEMTNACLEITCPRDIARQILRHRSFSFQEFSQRYQKVERKIGRIYMNGNIRSWIFYLKQRLDPATQKEHRIVAQQVQAILREHFPNTMEAAGL